MGKTGKWLKNFFTGKKDNNKEKIKEKSSTATSLDESSSSTANENYPTTPISVPTNPKEKSRWSFRRSSATAPRESNAAEVTANVQQPLPVSEATLSDADDQQKQQALAVAAATAAAADAAVAAAQAAAAVIRLTASTATGTPNIMEEVAAIKIQSVFRSYLARKALKALRGLVKLQALVRGHLVRKQAKATLRCMQTLVDLQAKVLAHRRVPGDDKNPMIPTPPVNHSPTPIARSRQIHHGGDHRFSEENVKIVEMDVGEFRGSWKSTTNRTTDPSAGTPISYYHHHNGLPSPAVLSSASALTEFGPETGHFDDHIYYTTKPAATAQTSPQVFSEPPFSYDYPLYPNYMANTESSRAKARSQSAPKQRPAEPTPHFERQPSNRRRPSVEGRSGVSLPRAVRMQRSSSNLSSTAAAQNFHYPWSLKLDRSAMSVRDSECDSICTFLTSTEYCRSLVGFDVASQRKNGVVGARY